MEKENINEFMVHGKKEVMRPCSKLCRRMTKGLRAIPLAGAGGYLAGGVPWARSGKRKVVRAAIAATAITSAFRMLRAKIMDICNLKCYYRALGARLKETKDPMLKKKITLKMREVKARANTLEAQLEMRFRKLKQSGKYAKLEKFEAMYRATKRI